MSFMWLTLNEISWKGSDSQEQIPVLLSSFTTGRRQVPPPFGITRIYALCLISQIFTIITVKNCLSLIPLSHSQLNQLILIWHWQQKPLIMINLWAVAIMQKLQQEELQTLCLESFFSSAAIFLRNDHHFLVSRVSRSIAYRQITSYSQHLFIPVYILRKLTDCMDIPLLTCTFNLCKLRHNLKKLHQF